MKNWLASLLPLLLKLPFTVSFLSQLRTQNSELLSASAFRAPLVSLISHINVLFQILPNALTPNSDIFSVAAPSID
jgi:hypothetical protein